MPGQLLRVDVGDLTFDVRASGPEDGRPVLLLHGFPETSGSWAAVTPLLTAVSVPHPTAFTTAFRSDPEQKERSAYIRLFWQEGKAEEVLLADDARRLRRMFGDAVPAEAVDEYVAVLSAPGALTAALNWYRAMSAATPFDDVTVPTTYVWSDDDVAIGRRAAEGCAEHVAGDYRFVELAGISHWVPEQAPEQLAVAVLDRIAST